MISTFTHFTLVDLMHKIAIGVDRVVSIDLNKDLRHILLAERRLANAIPNGSKEVRDWGLFAETGIQCAGRRVSQLGGPFYVRERIDSMKTVELHQAFLWVCDCGRDNFERGITLEAESVDLDRIARSVDVDPEAVRSFYEDGGEGVWIAAPVRVSCRHCGAEFKVVSGDEQEEELTDE